MRPFFDGRRNTYWSFRNEIWGETSKNRDQRRTTWKKGREPRKTSPTRTASEKRLRSATTANQRPATQGSSAEAETQEQKMKPSWSTHKQSEQGVAAVGLLVELP